MESKKRILVLCPLDRDRRELGLLSKSHEILFHDFSVLSDRGVQKELTNQDVLAVCNEIDRFIRDEEIDGILSTSDDLGTLLVAIIAQKNNFPAPDPGVIVRQQHKAQARITHKQFVPEATPKTVVLMNDVVCALPYPFFIKPVRSNFSRGSQAVFSQEDFSQAFQEAAHCSVVQPWFYLAQNYVPDIATGVLAEELCQGLQCTVEGFVYKHTIELMGIVDSIMYPGTISFKQFNYPSSLPMQVQERIWQIVSKLIRGIGFNNGCFNVECMYDPETDKIRIIELNPRLASQFADLYQKVDGYNSYEVLLSIAAGESPRIVRKNGEFNAAASCVLRTFTDHTIAKLPSPECHDTICAQYPEVRIEVFGTEGQRLSDFMQDGKSFRYGLIHVGGSDTQEIEQKRTHIESMLGIELLPV